MQMSGLLSAFPPAELLQWAHNDRVTGVLVMRRSSREKRVLLRGGKVVGCLSNERFDLYGQFLLANGHVSEVDLLRALSETEQREDVRLGEALVRLGILDEAATIDSLREATEQSILDIFVWPRGVFFVLDDEPAASRLEIPPIDPVGLVLEGARQIDEIARIRERLPHDGVVLHPGPAWPGERLSSLARRIVGVFTRDLTLGELHDATGGGYCQFLTEADQLLRARVFDIERFGEPDKDTRTLSLLDLMLDRIHEERQTVIGATVAMPIAVLGQLYPLWLGPTDDGRAHDDESLQAFATGLDGSRRLDSLLGEETEERDRQLEWLWLEMSAKRVALLPSAADKALGALLAQSLASS